MFGCYLEARAGNGALATLRASCALFLVASFAVPWQSKAASSELETVLTSARQRIETLDYRMSGRLTRVEGDGKRTNYKFVGKAHWFSDGLRLLCEISGRGTEKTRILLQMNANGHVTVQALFPGQKAPSALPFERWNDPLVGTDFTIEDMIESYVFWKSQDFVASEKFGVRDCFVVKSKPGSQDRSYYDSVTSWTDRGILYPVHVVKTLHGTGQQKEFVSFGLRQVGGVWTATQVEAKTQGKPGSSLLVIEAGSPKANLQLKDFAFGSTDTEAEKAK